MKYSVKTNKGLLGPFSANRIRKLTAAGKLKPEHMILTEEGVTIRVASVIAEAPAPANDETEADSAAGAAAEIEADEVARPTTRKVNRPKTGTASRTSPADARTRTGSGAAAKAKSGGKAKPDAEKAATVVAESDQEEKEDADDSAADQETAASVPWLKLVFSKRGLVVFIPVAIAALLIAGAADADSGVGVSGAHKASKSLFLAIGGALGMTGALVVGLAFAILGIGLFYMLNRQHQTQ